MRGLLPIAAASGDAPGALIFPAANLREAAIVASLRLFPVDSLMAAARVLLSDHPVPAPAPTDATSSSFELFVDDLSEVRGQLAGKRAIEIAAAGAHHLLLSGPPGAGKTMLARRLPGILPPLELREALAVTTIHSVAGQLPARGGLMGHRPFRAPHHTCSDIALVGGGSTPRPGELSLAHGGVLFLDELPEFNRHCLEALREPMESGMITLARAGHRITYPARFQLVAAMNPCACGYLGDAEHACRCTPDQILRYRSRISGPLLDRFDLHIQVNRLPPGDLLSPHRTGECTEVVRARVIHCRLRQENRQGAPNAQLAPDRLASICSLAEREKQWLETAATRLHLSGRGLHRTLRVARTIADLEECEAIGVGHLSEALGYRSNGSPD